VQKNVEYFGYDFLSGQSLGWGARILKRVKVGRKNQKSLRLAGLAGRNPS
jgi:hypothetical protein